MSTEYLIKSILANMNNEEKYTAEQAAAYIAALAKTAGISPGEVDEMTSATAIHVAEQQAMLEAHFNSLKKQEGKINELIGDMAVDDSCTKPFASPLSPEEHAANLAAAQSIAGPAKPPQIELELVCRRCGEAFTNPTGYKDFDEAYTGLVNITIRYFHRCKDTNYGIADILGFRDRSVEKPQMELPESPDFLPGGWVKINALLHNPQINEDYHLRYLGNGTGEHYVVIITNKGNRYCNMFKTEKSATGNYFQLGQYRQYFPQILE